MHNFTVFIRFDNVTKAKSTTFTKFLLCIFVCESVFHFCLFFCLIFWIIELVHIIYCSTKNGTQYDSLIRIIALAEFTLLLIMVTLPAENAKGNGIQWRKVQYNSNWWCYLRGVLTFLLTFFGFVLFFFFSLEHLGFYRITLH